MTFEDIIYEARDGIATITMNRPESRNAVRPQTYEELTAAFGMAGNDVLDGGPGNDTISGGSGDDTVIYRVGEGFDTVGTMVAPLVMQGHQALEGQ